MKNNMQLTRQGAVDKQTLDIINNQSEFLGAVLVGSADVIPGPGYYLVGASGVDAMTLVAPIAGSAAPVPGSAIIVPVVAGQDGFFIYVLDIGGHAHTITTPTNAINGSKHIATFNGTQNSFIELVAYNGIYYVNSVSGVALS